MYDQGGEKCVSIYEDLSDKYGASVMLILGLAVAKMHQGNFEEAEVHLQEALNKVQSIAFCGLSYVMITYHMLTGPLQRGLSGQHDCSGAPLRQAWRGHWSLCEVRGSAVIIS